LGIGFAVFVAGCATPMHELREHAAYAFGCSLTNQLRVTQVDEQTWSVEGCGNEATYLRVCSHGLGKIRCNWFQLSIKYPNPNEGSRAP
jgi:hypothetical protein